MYNSDCWPDMVVFQSSCHLTTTLLMQYAFRYLHRKLSRSGNRTLVRSHYKGVIFLVVESGVLYTAAGVRWI